MMPAVVTMATVAEPWASRSAALMRYAETITGSPIAAIEPARALPTPVACSTAPKNAPAPTTSRIMPIGLSDSPVIRASSPTVMPRRIPSRYMASSTATVSATVGVPRKNTIDWRFDPGARTTLPNVARGSAPSGPR